MKNVNKTHHLKFSLFIFYFVFIQPSILFAQISTKEPQSANASSESKSNPVVIFKIATGHAFFDNHLIVNLPAGASLQNNGDGVYQINNMPDVFGNYSIKLRSDGYLLNGVTTADISLIQRHILGNGALDGPYKLIAADVSCDGRISARDMVEIRKAILEKSDKFGCDTNFTFSPDTLNFEWTGNTIDLGLIIPIKMGDVNNSAVYNSEN